MYTGSNNKFQKPVKTKFRKTHDVDENKTTNNKQKHHDRSLYDERGKEICLIEKYYRNKFVS